MRLDYARVLPAARNAMLGLERVVHDSRLDPKLVELVKVRASQLNGCARCLEMHTNSARLLGEDPARLDVVAAWREATCFSEPERAALAWCETLTLIAERGVPDELYDTVAKYFAPEEVVALTLGVAAINAWNRLNVAFHAPSGGDTSPRETRA